MAREKEAPRSSEVLDSSDPSTSSTGRSARTGPVQPVARLLGAACALALVASLVWLTYFQPEDPGLVVVLVLSFALSIIGIAVFLGPYWKQRDTAQHLATGLAGSVGITGLLVGVLQVLPEDAALNVGSVGSPSSSPDVGTSPTPEPTTSGSLADYQTCYQQVKAAAKDGIVPPVAGELQAGVATATADARTVVVTDGESTWACNIAPTMGVSHPGPVVIGPADVEPSKFRLAEYGRPNFFWGGGAVPFGVTHIEFTFPDGDVEEAVIGNGYWVMQHFPRAAIKDVRDVPPIGVRLQTHNRQSGYRFPLEWGTDTCNQVGYGC